MEASLCTSLEPTVKQCMQQIENPWGPTMSCALILLQGFFLQKHNAHIPNTMNNKLFSRGNQIRRMHSIYLCMQKLYHVVVTIFYDKGRYSMKFYVYTLSLKSQLQPTYCKIVISFQIIMHFSTAIYMNCTTLERRLLVLYNPKFDCILTGTLPRWLHVPNERDEKKSPRMEDSVNERPTQQQRKTNEEGPPTVFCKSLGLILSIIWFFVIT